MTRTGDRRGRKLIQRRFLHCDTRHFRGTMHDVQVKTKKDTTTCISVPGDHLGYDSRWVIPRLVKDVGPGIT